MTALDKALPQFLGAMLDCLPPKEREGVEELRLREGFPLSAVQAGEEWTHPAWRNRPLTEEDLRRVVETAGRTRLERRILLVRNRRPDRRMGDIAGALAAVASGRQRTRWPVPPLRRPHRV